MSSFPENSPLRERLTNEDDAGEHNSYNFEKRRLSTQSFNIPTPQQNMPSTSPPTEVFKVSPGTKNRMERANAGSTLNFTQSIVSHKTQPRVVTPPASFGTPGEERDKEREKEKEKEKEKGKTATSFQGPPVAHRRYVDEDDEEEEYVYNYQHFSLFKPTQRLVDERATLWPSGNETRRRRRRVWVAVVLGLLASLGLVVGLLARFYLREVDMTVESMKIRHVGNSIMVSSQLAIYNPNARSIDLDSGVTTAFIWNEDQTKSVMLGSMPTAVAGEVNSDSERRWNISSSWRVDQHEAKKEIQSILMREFILEVVSVVEYSTWIFGREKSASRMITHSREPLIDDDTDDEVDSEIEGEEEEKEEEEEGRSQNLLGRSYKVRNGDAKSERLEDGRRGSSLGGRIDDELNDGNRHRVESHFRTNTG